MVNSLYVFVYAQALHQVLMSIVVDLIIFHCTLDSCTRPLKVSSQMGTEWFAKRNSHQTLLNDSH